MVSRDVLFMGTTIGVPTPETQAPRREGVRVIDSHAEPPIPQAVNIRAQREMADKDGRCELPIAPGQVYIEVEYDYEYKAKDKMVTIKQGECYILVRKTNEDWWQVRKDENTKPFYVPAQYVREVRKALMPPPKPLNLGGPTKAKPTVLDIRRSDENLNKQAEMSSFGRRSPGQLTPPTLCRDANQNPGSPAWGSGKSLAEHFQNNNASSTLPRVRADSPPPRAPDHARSPLLGRKPHLELDVERAPPLCDSAGEGSEKLRNDSESGDDLSSSSTEHMQSSPRWSAGESGSLKWDERSAAWRRGGGAPGPGDVRSPEGAEGQRDPTPAEACICTETAKTTPPAPVAPLMES
ncbi:hypothetical protein MATL_G00023930 [Megalops atlanticus]|uniref:SH3 domain-containing protein n=1 Tax=Megalops atlanticus TaxID=7932 RepID=A0A9D3THU5_MEGAT|nr:hypothetical protein MATL_G00023930 [Megalops atlanticus]